MACKHKLREKKKAVYFIAIIEVIKIMILWTIHKKKKQKEKS